MKRVWARFILSVLFVLPLALFSLGIVGVLAAGVTTQYKASQPFMDGMLAAAVTDQTDTVEPARQEHPERIIGVVVSFDESLIALGGESEGTVQVASEGRLSVLVSDIQGNIDEGDLLTISPITGLAMRASDEPIIIGTALSSFEGEPEKTLGTAEVGDSSGKKQTVRISKVQVQFEAGPNPANIGISERIPGFLQGIGTVLADKPVSPIRGGIALIVFLITLILSGVLLYSAIRSAIISIGRNPLSKRTVYVSLVQVFGLVALVLTAGLGTIYITLRL